MHSGHVVQDTASIAADQKLTIVEHEPVTDVGEPNTPPLAFALWPNVPNPFTGTTRIRFDLPRAARGDLRVYALQGRRVRSWSEAREWPAGRHAVEWDGRATDSRRAAPGVYFYLFESTDFRAVQRLILLR